MAESYKRTAMLVSTFDDSEYFDVRLQSIKACIEAAGDGASLQLTEDERKRCATQFVVFELREMAETLELALDEARPRAETIRSGLVH